MSTGLQIENYTIDDFNRNLKAKGFLKGRSLGWDGYGSGGQKRICPITPKKWNGLLGEAALIKFSGKINEVVLGNIKLVIRLEG